MVRTEDPSSQLPSSAARGRSAPAASVDEHDDFCGPGGDSMTAVQLIEIELLMSISGGPMTRQLAGSAGTGP